MMRGIRACEKNECVFSRNFCGMGPSSKDVFDHIVTHV